MIKGIFTQKFVQNVHGAAKSLYNKAVADKANDPAVKFTAPSRAEVILEAMAEDYISREALESVAAGSAEANKLELMASSIWDTLNTFGLISGYEARKGLGVVPTTHS